MTLMRRRQQVMTLSSTSIVSRSVLFMTLGVCGVSLWLLYGYAYGDKRVKEPADLPAVAREAADDDTGAVDVKKKAETDLGVAGCKSCQELISVYERISNDFSSKGLDPATITAIQPWFHGIHSDETPWPKRYEDFPEPLPNNSVRLLVLPLDGAPALAAAAAAITRDVLALLPNETKAFCNARTHYHCTLFHTSHPSDTRPDPFDADGLGPEPAPPSKRPAPTPAMLAAEAEAVGRLVAGGRAPRLVLDRVLMASSGTLLMTWVDPSGRVPELRRKLRSAFPGACGRQASIIHTSLLRLLSEQQLSEATVGAVAEVCRRWTAKLQGKVLMPATAWWVLEHEFSTIVGDRTVFSFQAQ